MKVMPAVERLWSTSAGRGATTRRTNGSSRRKVRAIAKDWS